MKKEQDLRTYFKDEFAHLSQGLNGSQSSEIATLRKSAVEALDQMGFPQAKHEEYKYTPITKTLLRSLAENSASVTEPQVVPPFNEHLIEGLQGHLVVFWNGRLVYRPHELDQGLSIEPMDGHGQQQLMQHYLGSVALHQSDAFTALNTAMFNHGTCIKVSKQQVINQPILIYNLWDQNANYLQSRNLVIAESHSESQIVEVFKTVDAAANSFHNSVMEVVVAENAHLSYHKIQTECGASVQVGNTHVQQADNSTVKCTTITTAGRMVRNNLNLTVNGQNCESHMYGLYLIDGNNHVDNHTMVDHCLPNSFSNELYKGILADKSTGVFNGKIFVRQDAQKTNAFQSNKNLLLSDHASMNTKPQLEIWADDVKCSHGATTGQLDAEQMFYLRARGLDENQARALLLHAFAQETLEQVSSEELRAYLDGIIQKRLYSE